MRLRAHCRLVVLAAAALLGGDLAARSHAIVVAHAICAEHGEPIHLASDANASSGPADVDAVSAGDRTISATDDHEHCAVAGGTRRVGPPAFAALVMTLRGIAPLAGTGIVLDPAVPLFRLAPKNSPPV